MLFSRCFLPRRLNYTEYRIQGKDYEKKSPIEEHTTNPYGKQGFPNNLTSR